MDRKLLFFRCLVLFAVCLFCVWVVLFCILCKYSIDKIFIF